MTICRSGGMSSETTNCSPDFSTIGTKATLSLSKDRYLTVENYVTVKIPVSINALVAFIGAKDVSIKCVSSASDQFDSDGVSWSV